MAATRSLPDLVARLRIDLTQAKASLAESKRDIASVGVHAGVSAEAISSSIGHMTEAQSTHVKNLQRQLTTLDVGVAASTSTWNGLFEGITARAKKAGDAMVVMAEKAKFAAETAAKTSASVGLEGKGGMFGGAAGAIGGSGMGAIPVLGAAAVGLAAGAGLLAMMDELARKTSKYSVEILRNSELLGMNSTQYQVLANATEKFGMSQDDLTRVMLRFESNIEKGGPNLKSLGLTLADVGITSTDVGTATNQLSAFLNSNTDATQKNAVAQALLGKGAAALNEVLSKGPQFLADYQKYLQSTGQLLDDNQLKTGALAQAVHDNLMGALKGLELQVGTQLEASFSVLEQAMIGALGGGKVAFENISKAIAEVVGWVATFIATLTGQDMGSIFQGISDAATGVNNQMNAGTAAAANNAAAFDGAAGSAGNAAGANKALAAEIKAVTDAAKDQTAAIQATAKSQTDSINDEIKGLQQSETALNEKFRMEGLLQQQADDNHTSKLAQLQDELAAAQNVDSTNRRSGESLVAYARRMRQEELKDQIKKEQDGRKITTNAHAILLEQTKIETASKIDALTKQKQAIADATAAEVKSIQDALQVRLDALNAEKAATGSAAGSMADSHRGAAAKANGSWTSAMADMAKQSHKTAEAIAQTIRDIFQHPEKIADLAGNMFKEAGKAMIGGLWNGIIDGVGSIDVMQLVRAHPWLAPLLLANPGAMIPIAVAKGVNAIQGLGGGDNNMAGAAGVIASSGLHQAQGGPALAMTPYVWNEAGVELFASPRAGHVLNAEQVKTLTSGAGGGSTVTINTGPVATEYVLYHAIAGAQREIAQRSGSMRPR